MMSLFEGFGTLRLVKTGPSLWEQLERRVAAVHHKAVTARLRRFRCQLERDATPDPWTELEAPMILLVSDLCAALGLDERERERVLGRKGTRALATILESRPALRPPQVAVNERQNEALRYVHRCGKIDLSAYRAICPLWSDETLRLDLADLVSRGVLARNGRNKGTHYTLPELTA
jgi:hypothetical protein